LIYISYKVTSHLRKVLAKYSISRDLGSKIRVFDPSY